MLPSDWLFRALKKNLPDLFLRGAFEFRVTKYTGGRISLEPVRAKWLQSISLCEQWSMGGTDVRPRDGSSVIVMFIDADESRPVICDFAPLSATKPISTRIDADTVTIGDPATSPKGIARLDDPTDGGWLSGAVSGGAVVFTLASVASPGAIHLTGKISGASSKGKCQ